MKSAKNAIPEGFVVLSSRGEKWDFDKEPICVGVVASVEAVEVGQGRAKRTARVMTLNTVSGPRTVWESAGLRALFTSTSPGDEVFIRYEGEEDVGQPQPMRVFTVAKRVG